MVHLTHVDLLESSVQLVNDLHCMSPIKNIGIILVGSPGGLYQNKRQTQGDVTTNEGATNLSTDGV